MSESINNGELDQAHAQLVNSYCPLWSAMYHRLVKSGVPEKQATTMVCAYIDVSIMAQHDRSIDPLSLDDAFDEDSDFTGPFPNGE